MRLHKTRINGTRDQSFPRSLQRMSGDKILDLTADVLYFCNILKYIKNVIMHARQYWYIFYLYISGAY